MPVGAPHRLSARVMGVGTCKWANVESFTNLGWRRDAIQYHGRGRDVHRIKTTLPIEMYSLTDSTF